jgi:hypothetical protein
MSAMWIYTYVIVFNLGVSVQMQSIAVTEAQCRALIQRDPKEGLQKSECLSPDGKWPFGQIGDKQK